MTRVPWLMAGVKQKGIRYFEVRQVDNEAIQDLSGEVCDLDLLMRR